MSSPTARLAPSDLAARAPVWEALSEFWLDTELGAADHARIAAVIAASPFTIPEVRAILDFEVSPAVGANGVSVAGVWEGFDSAWLRAACEQRALRPRSPWRRAWIALWLPYYRLFTSRHWQAVLPQVQALRARGTLEQGDGAHGA